MKRMHSIDLYSSGEWNADQNWFEMDRKIESGRYYFEMSLYDDMQYTFCGFINVGTGESYSTQFFNYDTGTPMCLVVNTGSDKPWLFGTDQLAGYDDHILKIYRIN